MEIVLVFAVMVQYASAFIFTKVVRRLASFGSPDYPAAELLAGSLQVLSTALYLIVAIRGRLGIPGQQAPLPIRTPDQLRERVPSSRGP